MQMHPEGFVRLDRGPYLFDIWHWPERVPTALGNLVVELTTSDDEPPPDAAMAAAASELAEFAVATASCCPISSVRDCPTAHHRANRLVS
jgi:hypothetical protein